MSQADQSQITLGMQKYIDRNNDYLGKRDAYIHDVVKKWKFDTIAVHGLYSMQDAIEDYQGSIMEPVFLSTSQAFRLGRNGGGPRMPDSILDALRIANLRRCFEWVLALLKATDSTVKRRPHQPL
jgi:hypothetical protein